MSTIASNPLTPASKPFDRLQLSPHTRDLLIRFGRRRKTLLIARSVAIGTLVWLAAMMAIAIVDFALKPSDAVLWSLSLGGYAFAITAAWFVGLRHLRGSDPKTLARQLESIDPRLRDDLLSAVEFSDPDSANGSESFRDRLQQSIERRTEMLNMRSLLPWEMVRRSMMACAIVLIVCASLTLIPRAQFGRRFARAMLPGIAIERASLTRLTIVEPSPPTRYVAQGDAVGVMVRVGGLSVDEVFLQHRVDGGDVDETRMSARTLATASVADDAGLFAANVSVNSDPVEYRIIAGDAITLWHTLTPQPRPRIKSFVKDYQFPSYARLPDRSESADDGDLRALVGTRATVTVEFDEPVDEPTFKFGVRGPSYAMEPVDQSTTRFKSVIPIRTPSVYQVDATSVRSGLNNPFSPQYTITPIIDTPPMVRWGDDQAESILASPLDVVSFSAVAIDDLPMDKLIQEYQLNREPLTQRSIAMDDITGQKSGQASSKEIDVRWDWDLLRRETDVTGKSVKESKKLSAGDVIRTRFVAIDRLGNRGETNFLEVLIVDENFNPDRHDRLDQIAGLTRLVTEWTQRHAALMKTLRETIAANRTRPETTDTVAELDELLVTSEPLLKVARDQTTQSRSLAEARVIELVGRGIIDLDGRSRAMIARIESAASNASEAWKPSAEKILRQAENEAKQLGDQSERIEQLMQNEFASQFTRAIASDVAALHRSVKPLVADDDASGQLTMTTERLLRHLVIVSRRLKMVDGLLEKHVNGLPDSTRRHFQQWDRWSSNMNGLLQQAVDSEPVEQHLGNLITLFKNESLEQYTHRMTDGRLSQTLQSMMREIPNTIGPLSNRIGAMKDAGRDSVRAAEQILRGDDSDKTAIAVRDKAFADAEFALMRELIANRIAAEQSLHRSLPSIDLRYAADLNLIGRAIENVSENGYVAYKDESADQVFENLSRAFQQIEGLHEAGMGLREIQSLRDAERRLRGSVREKFDHPDRMDHYIAAMEWPVRTMREAGVDWKAIEPIDQARYNASVEQARSRITSRRWSGDTMVSAETSLSEIESSLGDAIDNLEPTIETARQTILRYVLSLPEQAEKAAESVRTADDSNDQDAESEVDKTLQALVDLANNADLNSDAERELARDADAATAQINDAKKRAEEASPDNADTMNDLAETLEQTAEHFRAAENGEDVSQSREALRKAEAELQIESQLQKRFDQAKAMASAAESSPQEMMERLEQELQRSPPMQNELSEIAKAAADSAKAGLERAVREEASLEQSLQRSDPSIREQKARAARAITNLARRATTVEQTLLNASENAAKSASAPEVDRAITQARKTLQQSVQATHQMGGESASLEQMKSTANALAEAIQSASQALGKASQAASKDADKAQHDDDARRKREAEQFERSQRDVRTQRARAAGQERQEWSNAERDAGRNVQQAQREMRDAERSIGQIKQRIEKEKNDPSGLIAEQKRNEEQIGVRQGG